MRIGFASIVISDEDKAIEFYTGKLGFQLVTDFPTPFGGRFLRFAPSGGGAMLVMSRAVPGAGPTQAGGFSNIAWETDDIQATYADLMAKGVQFSQPPTKQPWGGIQARFSDPDGNVFQLNQVEKQ